MYFINPSWLCRLMAKIITVEAVHKCIRSGILNTGDLKDFIIREDREFPHYFYNKYLRLLYRFQIACPIDNDRALVPSKLPKNPLRVVHEPTDRNILFRRHIFSCIPFGLWERFVSRLLLFMKDMLAPSSSEEEGTFVNGEECPIQPPQYNTSTSQNSARDEEVNEEEEEDDLNVSINQPQRGTGVVYASPDSIIKTQEASPSPSLQSNSEGPVSYLQRTVSVVNGVELTTSDNPSSELAPSSTNSEDESSNVPSLGSIYPVSDSSTSHDTISFSTGGQTTASSCRDDIASLSSETSRPQQHSLSSASEIGSASFSSTKDGDDTDNDTCFQPVNCTKLDEDSDDDDLLKATNPLQSSVSMDTVVEVDAAISYSKILSPSQAVDSRPKTFSPRNDIDVSQLEGEDEEQDENDDQITVSIVKPETLAPKMNNDGGKDSQRKHSFQEESSIICDENDNVSLHSDSLLSSSSVENSNTNSFDSTTANILENNGRSTTDSPENIEDDTFEGATSEMNDGQNINDIIGSRARGVSDSVFVRSTRKLSNSRRTNSLPEVTSHRKNLKKSSSPSSFDDFVDVAHLFDEGILTCWKTGITFNHPKLFFSVCKKKVRGPVPNFDNNSENSVETKVSNNSIGHRVLGYVLDHIRTLIKEWYPGLSGNDGEKPYVSQFAACPVCLRRGDRDPHMFNVQDAFNKLYICREGDNCLRCERIHSPQVVDVELLCPELLFKDLSKDLQIPRRELDFEETDDFFIGKGGFGSVYRGTLNRGLVQMPVAIKLYDFGDPLNAQDGFHDIHQEIFILSKLRDHQFIVKFKGFVIEPRLCALMELAMHGSLHSTLEELNKNKRPQGLHRVVLFRMMKQLASAMSFMHHLRIIHRDIKSDNILVFSTDPNAEVLVKLTDFGTANFLTPDGMKNINGTPGYRAPEMFNFISTDEYTTKVDIYSLAMVVGELITGRRPFHDLIHYQIPDALKRLERPRYTDSPESLYGLLSLTELMTKMWRQEITTRPNADELLKQAQSPAFQLLYGKRTLVVPQNPRAMCAVPSSQDMWVICDDINGEWLF